LLHETSLASKRVSANLTAQHLTDNGTTAFSDSVTNANSPTESTLAVTNSLLVGVSYSDSFTSSSNATNSSASATFQTVGAANNYLSPNSPYRTAGTANINPKS